MTESNKFEFQVNDWNHYHEIDSNDEEKYAIQLFGRTADDKDVCVKVCGFTPFFYVEVPQGWARRQVDKFVKVLKKRVSWRTSNNPKYTYDLSDSLINYTVKQKHKFRNFTNKKLFKYVMLVFKSLTAMREFSYALAQPLEAKGLTSEPLLYQRYESNIEPHIRFMHINNLSSCGWASIDPSKLVTNPKYSDCDHSYCVSWKDIKPADNDNRMAPFKIMGYDIECISCDHNFPQAERKTDKIIQIGMTMYRYGSMKCYEEHIVNLGVCADIPGATVECYKTERGLIRGWARKVRVIRPDFCVGYNNFGFDDSFIFNRIKRIDDESAAKLGISPAELPNKFIDEILMILGKVNNQYLMDAEGLTKSLTVFEVKDLTSSALGHNELKFFQVPGILSIDMMKVIQRDHRLIGYSLDNVSANFITEKCAKVVENETADGLAPIKIYTTSTKALESDAYIQIMVDDGYSSSPLCEGSKYSVHSITQVTDTRFNEKTQADELFEYQCIETRLSEKEIAELRTVLCDPLLKVFWTFAKDDMHHTLINKYHREGEPNNIARVAKYCLKDCKLVNLLLAKLEIIINGIGMAKVCHVPLSYLFLRGQGVKIFSLVAKKCRERNFLIPVLRRKQADGVTDDDETYEGATVITPRPDVYLSPISVLDYSSLYPNSMRECNLTQECYVADPKYDNLQGHIYHDIHITLKDKKGKIIRNIDGTPQKEHHRFAQELITEEQINVELKEIFDLIDSSSQANIKRYEKLEALSAADRKTILDHKRASLKKELERIEDTVDLSTKAKIRRSRKLEDRFARTEAKLTVLIDTETPITDAYRELLIELESASAISKKNAEKMKRYNEVNGQMVRYGILPEILTELLNKRKDTNNQLASETDGFKRAILNALQLAFKITANSLYGQTGAPTSPIYFVAIAASTTAIGRERLHMAKRLVESNFEDAEVIYGDTDSIFINFHFKDEDGNELTDRTALIKSIAAARRAAALINANVPKPQSIVYEKTFHPFILVAKKKYVGLKYESDPDKYVMASMGIVLKRRDNAPVVKVVCGGIIDHLLKNRDIGRAVEHTEQVITKLMNGGYPIDKFIISKTLKSRYKKPLSIAHKVLADRMAERDPGNKPQINDRIPFVYVVRDTGRKKKKDILQGDMIENPSFVTQNGLKIDYLHYLEHQIINPASQILELMMPKRQVDRMFRRFIIEEQNKRRGCQAIDKWIDTKRVKFSGSKTVSPPDVSAKRLKAAREAEIKSLGSGSSVGRRRKNECKNMERWLSQDRITAAKVARPVTQPTTAVSQPPAPVVKRKAMQPKKSSSMDKWIKGK